MQNNEEAIKKRARGKAEFYFREKLKAHVTIIPNGFKNGIFISELIDDTFYWFIQYIKNEEEKRIRLFLNEIFDVEDYEKE